MDNFPKLMEMLGLVGGGLEGHTSEHDAMKAITPELVLAAGKTHARYIASRD